jgi:transposase
MSKPIERVEIITGRERRRRHTAEEKVRLVEQTMQPGMTVSAVARLHGISPSLLFQGRGRGVGMGGIRRPRLECPRRSSGRLRRE